MTVHPATPPVLGSIATLMTRVLGGQFLDASWKTWRTLLRAVSDGLSRLDVDERAVVEQLTGRTVLPSKLAELWVIAGRRSGKSLMAALIAIWACCCCVHRLAVGEVGVFMIIAADRKQARVIKRYISGLLDLHPALKAMKGKETADEIWIGERIVIEIHTASFRSLRGYTCIGACCDEVCFWHAEDSANPDKEILIALKAAMATQPNALLVCLTSPYARRGEPWRTFDKHFGNNESDRVLVVNAPTRVLNPVVDQAYIDAQYEDDPIAAATEFGGEWRRDIEAFLPLEVLEAVRIPDRLELPFQSSVEFVGYVDPAGGTGRDSFTGAVAHKDWRSQKVVLDCVREIRPPFSPEGAVEELTTMLKRYRITQVHGDHYAGEWPREQFLKRGVTYVPSPQVKSDLYLECLPLLTTGRAELLDHQRLLKQFGALERRTARSGKDSIDHPPKQHDDVCNAAAGALVLASGVLQRGGYAFSTVRWIE